MGTGHRVCTPLTITVRMMYPLTLIFIIGLAARQSITTRLSALRQKVIDAEYVLEEKVENYEPSLDAENVPVEEGIIEILEGEEDGLGGEWVDEDDNEGDVLVPVQ